MFTSNNSSFALHRIALCELKDYIKDRVLLQPILIDTNDVFLTSFRRRKNVLTLQWRCFYVETAPCACCDIILYRFKLSEKTSNNYLLQPHINWSVCRNIQCTYAILSAKRSYCSNRHYKIALRTIIKTDFAVFVIQFVLNCLKAAQQGLSMTLHVQLCFNKHSVYTRSFVCDHTYFSACMEEDGKLEMTVDDKMDWLIIKGC